MQDLVITSERIDDVLILLGSMIRINLPQILDKHVPTQDGAINDTYR